MPLRKWAEQVEASSVSEILPTSAYLLFVRIQVGMWAVSGKKKSKKHTLLTDIFWCKLEQIKIYLHSIFYIWKIFNWFFYFEIITDAHAVVRNYRESSCIPFTQFPPMLHLTTLCRATSQSGYWRWYNQDTEQFHLHETLFTGPFIAKPTLHPSPSHSSSASMATTDLFSVSIILPFQECCINGILQYVTLWEFFFSPTQSNSLEIHPNCWVNQRFILF